MGQNYEELDSVGVMHSTESGFLASSQTHRSDGWSAVTHQVSHFVGKLSSSASTHSHQQLLNMSSRSRVVMNQPKDGMSSETENELDTLLKQV